jgi:acyl carrier protein
MNVNEALRAYIIEDVFQGLVPEDFNDDYNLIESGAMDSLSMMKIITYLEQQFGVKFGLNDMVPKNFKSIESLSELALARLAPVTIDPV